MNKRFPKSARNSLFAFCAFVFIVFAFRHVQSDHEQNHRIEQLEIQIAQLEQRAALQAKSETRVLDNPETRKSGNKTNKNSGSRNLGTQEPRNPENKGNTPSSSISTPPYGGGAGGGSAGGAGSAGVAVAEKFHSPIRLELNLVDSATLVRVPGIAGKTAGTILKYREALGGFYSPDQLRERLTWESAQERMDEWCCDWFTADESLIRIIAINKVSFSELLHHPYFNYDQVKAVIRYRDKHKRIDSFAQLEQLGCFEPETLEKLKHYCSFE